MKIESTDKLCSGSVLLVTMLTVTILTMICATSLYITSQTATNATQTASWHEALTGAESGIERAITAMNQDAASNPQAWSTWKNVNAATLPAPNPNPTPTSTTATAKPTVGYYNYLSSNPNGGSATPISISGEGSPKIYYWVTIDPVSSTFTSKGQWYRVRSTGTAFVSGPRRAPLNKLDNNLRKVSLFFDRTNTSGNSTFYNINSPRVSRTIEVILQPLASPSAFTYAVATRNYVTMSGGARIDSFNSSDPTKSTNGMYDPAKAQKNASVGIYNASNTNLGGLYVGGNLTYNGTTPKNTGGVTGTIATPWNVTIPAMADPVAAGTGYTWTDPNLNNYQWTSYTTQTGGQDLSWMTTISPTGTQSNPTLIKVNGNFVHSGSNSTYFQAPTTGTATTGTQYYVTMWVTGQFNLSGSSSIKQDPNVHVTWIVDGDITDSGGTYNNLSGLAANTSFVGVGTSNKLTISGSSNWIGTVDAPGYDVNISGSGTFSGAVVGNSLTLSGTGGVHYDEALSSSSKVTAAGAYAVASWFEDNSEPNRGLVY